MAASRDDFEQWLFEIDDRLEELMRVLPSDISTKMDYSADSLSLLEGWVLKRYANIREILNESEKHILDMLASYVGETFRKSLGGIWNIDQKNEKNVYFRMPVIEKQGCWIKCPITLVTASTDRRSGGFMAGVLKAIARHHGTA